MLSRGFAGLVYHLQFSRKHGTPGSNVFDLVALNLAQLAADSRTLI